MRRCKDKMLGRSVSKCNTVPDGDVLTTSSMLYSSPIRENKIVHFSALPHEGEKSLSHVVQSVKKADSSINHHICIAL